MRLIDADTLIETMEERKKIWLSKCEYNDAIRKVKEAPTVEKPHGEWEYSIVDCYKSGYLCPRCKGFAVIEGKSDGYSVTFCPNCGSRNRTEENNSSSMVIDGKYSENVEYGTRVEKKEGE